MEERVATEKKPVFPWLTGEIALYALILLLALALRLGGLGMRVMDVPEAEQAWQAWQLTRGQAATGSYSPLLLSGQALLFILFGAGDAAARLWPALAGSAMVLTPYFVRSSLGRIGSLAAALALAISPSLIYSSRYGNGGMLLVACMLGLMTLWLAYEKDRRPAYLYAIAVMGAFALLADPRVVGVLIVQGVAWAMERFLFRRNLFDASADQRDASVRSLSWKGFGLTLGVTLVLGATAFAFNPGGLGTWADFPSLWAMHLAPVVNGQPWYYPLSALILYEPFLLIFGLIGGVDLLIRRDKASILTWLAMGLLVVALLAGGRDVGDVALACAPMALLAGRALDNLVDSWQREARLGREGIFVGVGLVLLVYLAFQTAFYARTLYVAHPEAEQFLWLWLLGVALVVVLAGVFLAWFGTLSTWRAGGALVALALLAIVFSAAVGLNFRHASDPRELHVRAAPSEGTRDALRVMAGISLHRRGYPTAMPVTVESSLGPVWPWYLRDWEEVTIVDQLTPDVATPMVLASFEEQNPTLGDNYTGQDFVTRTWWEPGQLASNDQLTWWLYRKSVSSPMPLQKVILWVKAEEQIANSE